MPVMPRQAGQGRAGAARPWHHGAGRGQRKGRGAMAMPWERFTEAAEVEIPRDSEANPWRFIHTPAPPPPPPGAAG